MESSNTNSYGPPVNQLLTYGNAQEGDSSEKWPNYLELGLGLAQISDLIRMVADEDLNDADLGSLRASAPAHAWRALGQLRAEEVIEPLLALLNVESSDWLLEELPEVFALIGPVALPTLAAYIADVSHDEFARTAVFDSIEQIAVRWPESRPACIASLMKQLERFEENGETANGFFIASLVRLRATEAVPLIEQVFEADFSAMGEWEDVQEKFGLLSAEKVEQRRVVAQQKAKQAAERFSVVGTSEIASPLSGNRRHKDPHQKNKSKMAKQSRKKNRKR